MKKSIYNMTDEELIEYEVNGGEDGYTTDLSSLLADRLSNCVKDRARVMDILSDKLYDIACVLALESMVEDTTNTDYRVDDYDVYNYEEFVEELTDYTDKYRPMELFQSVPFDRLRDEVEDYSAYVFNFLSNKLLRGDK